MQSYLVQCTQGMKPKPFVFCNTHKKLLGMHSIDIHTAEEMHHLKTSTAFLAPAWLLAVMFVQFFRNVQRLCFALLLLMGPFPSWLLQVVPQSAGKERGEKLAWFGCRRAVLWQILKPGLGEILMGICWDAASWLYASKQCPYMRWLLTNCRFTSKRVKVNKVVSVLEFWQTICLLCGSVCCLTRQHFKSTNLLQLLNGPLWNPLLFLLIYVTLWPAPETSLKNPSLSSAP